MKKRMLNLMIATSILLECLAPHMAYAGEPKMRPLTDAEIIERSNSNYGSDYGFGENIVPARSKVQMTNEVLDKAAKIPGVKIAGHQLQTIVLISILTLGEIVSENLKVAKISRTSVSPANMASDFTTAANEMFNSPDYWSSVSGGMMAGLPSKGADAMLKKIFANVSSKNIFKNLTISGAQTLITFLGWEFFGELVAEARKLIPDRKDRERSRQFSTLLSGLMAQNSRGHRMTFEETENKRVAKLLFSNMSLILFHDSHLRGILVSNTWRHRIATGQFVTLVSFMAAGGTAGAMAGTAIFPGGGTIVGIAFGFLGGLVGGVATLVVPEKVQNGMTAWFRDIRKGFWSLVQYVGAPGERNVGELYFSVLYRCISQNTPCPPVLLEQTRNYGQATKIDNYITVMFEEFYYYEHEIAVNTDYMALAQAARNVEAFKAYSAKVLELRDTYKRKLLELNNHTYAPETKQLEDLFKKYPLKREWTKKYPQLQGIFDYYTSTRRTTRGIHAYVRESIANLNGERKPFLRTMNKIYFFGFSRELFVAAITKPVRQEAQQ